MKILKQILAYLFWIGISFVAAFSYVRILIGPEPDESNGFLNLLDLLINRTVIVQLVPIIASIIAILFILTDIFYLKKKLKNNSKGIPSRFLVIMLITIVVGITHYILEKVIDII
ncbi:hypothetical protein [uncultured Winogradskyella sp.]|uniref:hypothetical protein n=1 Tax=uncultured Winogradskyella sp. TaxID=395353 RepID=UPI002639D424|nr:hypothetical protein [uncultured Winogradskyella sp.]